MSQGVSDAANVVGPEGRPDMAMVLQEQDRQPSYSRPSGPSL